MQNHLDNHMLNFADGHVSLQSLSTAAQAETADRKKAHTILMLLSGWENGSGSMGELRARVRTLI